jgi:hypothetical protein
MTTTARKLTVADLERALLDERHNGWGYATRYGLSESRRRQLDGTVVGVANELGLDTDQLFAWTDCKSARWLVDAASGGRINRHLVRGFLNEREVKAAQERD